MAEEEYTWAQIAGQLGAVMHQFQALVAFQDMLNQAAQVESYLANVDKGKEKLLSDLDDAKALLRDVAQEYRDLQVMIKKEKASHTQAMSGRRQKLEVKTKEVDLALQMKEEEVAAEIAELDARVIVHAQESSSLMAVIRKELDAKEAQLVETTTKLAALKESL